MGTMTRDTPWRTIGDISRPAFRGALAYVGSPYVAEADTCYVLGAGITGLLAALAMRESAEGTTGRLVEAKNPFGLTAPEGTVILPGVDRRFLAFPAWPCAFAEARRRLTDPTYREGNYRDTVSVADLVGTWVNGDPAKVPEPYLAALLADLTWWLNHP